MAYLTSGEVLELFGISRRNLGYWVGTDVVEPTVRAEGRGTRRLWDTPAAVHLGVVAKLREVGVTLSDCRGMRGVLEREVLTVLGGGGDFWVVAVGGGVAVLLTDLPRQGVAGLEVVEAGGAVDSAVVKVSEIIERVRGFGAEQLTMEPSEMNLSEGMLKTLLEWAVEEGVRFVEV